jgi:RimJ/RimL family protein N-acetyltransferase
MTSVATLVGPRVTLRAPVLDDADALFCRVASDPAVTRYLTWTPHPDADETRRVITELFNVGDHTTWLIDLNNGGGPIGTCGWRRIRRHTAEVGYCLGRTWWRQRYMTEVLALLIDHARRDPTLRRLVAYCHVDNPASARVLERSGFTMTARRARFSVFPNIGSEPQDCLLFAKAVR